MKDARRGGGTTGGGGGAASAAGSQHVTFSVLSTPGGEGEGGARARGHDENRFPDRRRWRALAALVALGLVALAASTATLAAPPAAPAPAPSSSSSSAADHERLVSELGLNGTQALLLDASRLRAYLASDAWRARKAALFPPPTSGSGSASAGAAEKSSSSSSSGRGVVIPAGGRDHLLNALVTVRHLRRVGCRLPVEVVYFGAAEIGQDDDGGGGGKKRSKKEASSARKAAAALALEPGVRLVDASRLASRESQARDLAHQRYAEPASFGKKVFAAAFACSFRQVLLLDGDALPLIDPAPLFDAPDFLSAGSMFWPDFWHNAWTDAKLWQALGVVPPWDRDEYEGGGGGGEEKGGGGGGGGRRWRHRLVESGQVLLDRARHADVLEWAWLLNGPNREAVYMAMHGDKDTWRLAFDLAGKSGGGYRHRQQQRGAEDGGGGDDDDDDDESGSQQQPQQPEQQRQQEGRFFLVPHMARDAMREGPAGHAHRWHHVGVLQAAPRGLPAVLEAASTEAAAAAAVAAGGDGGGGGKGGNGDAARLLRKRAEEAFGRAVAAARPSLSPSSSGGGSGEASGGWPLFLHRTSFNAKFFPDCARRPEDEEEDDEEGEKAAASSPANNGTAAQIPPPNGRRRRRLAYCRPTHASVPLADEQAARALKPHMYAFDAADVEDVSSSSSGSSPPHLRRCLERLAAAAAVAGSGDAAAAAAAAADAPGAAALLLAGGEGVEARCAPEGLGQPRGRLPVQVFEIDDVWPYVGRAVDASIGAYWQVRRAFWEAD